MARRYPLKLVALDEEIATFGNAGVVRASIPADVWCNDGRPTSVEMIVETPEDRPHGGPAL